MKFTKMHGCGNTYIYVNGFTQKVKNPSEMAVKVSDIRFGIGADGLIIIGPSKVADCKMSMYNMDGSEGKMCGNGIRCVGKFAYDYGLVNKEKMTVETLSGIKELKLNVAGGVVDTVVVDMGAPLFEPKQIPVKAEEKVINKPINIMGEEYNITCVSMGNPHAVIFMDDIESINIEKIGPAFEKNEIFPEGVNTEFIRVISKNEIDMRVWERGSNETWACGTGACAAVVAGVVNNLVSDEVIVHLRGGDLKIKYDRVSETVFMEGPAVTICEGEWKL